MNKQKNGSSITGTQVLLAIIGVIAVILVARLALGVVGAVFGVTFSIVGTILGVIGAVIGAVFAVVATVFSAVVTVFFTLLGLAFAFWWVWIPALIILFIVSRVSRTKNKNDDIYHV